MRAPSKILEQTPEMLLNESSTVSAERYINSLNLSSACLSFPFGVSTERLHYCQVVFAPALIHATMLATNGGKQNLSTSMAALTLSTIISSVYDMSIIGYPGSTFARTQHGPTPSLQIADQTKVEVKVELAAGTSVQRFCSAQPFR